MSFLQVKTAAKSASIKKNAIRESPQEVAAEDSGRAQEIRRGEKFLQDGKKGPKTKGGGRISTHVPSYIGFFYLKH